MHKREREMAEKALQKALQNQEDAEQRRRNNKPFTIWRKSASGLIQSPCMGRVWATTERGAEHAYAAKTGQNSHHIDCIAVAQ